MKDSGKWAVVFTVLNIILITVCVVLLLNKDRKPPVISFSGNDLIITVALTMRSFCREWAL